MSLIDFVQVTYPRRYEAVDGALRFTVPAGKAARVTGFGDPDVRVVDISEPDRPIELASAVVANGAGASAVFGAAPTGATLVIVSHPLFLDTVIPLVQVREAQDLRVIVRYSSKAPSLVALTGPTNDANFAHENASLIGALTCLNGYFNDVYTESLGEALLKAPSGGVVAVYATSALSAATEQVQMGTVLVAKRLDGRSRLGEAERAAKAASNALPLAPNSGRLSLAVACGDFRREPEFVSTSRLG